MSSETDGGVWIGIDFGTTHSCAAVWDSTRGRPKAMRLDSSIPEGAKHGRLVPTVLVLIHSTAQDQVSSLLRSKNPLTFYTSDDLSSLELVALVGAPALRLLHDRDQSSAGVGENIISPPPSPGQISDAMVTNLKLHFGAGAATTATEPSLSASRAVRVTPIGMSSPVDIAIIVLVQVFLAALKYESELYLWRNGRLKRLVVPQRQLPSATGAEGSVVVVKIGHAVIGVPCQWNQKLRQKLQRISVRHYLQESPFQPRKPTRDETSSRVVAWEPFRSTFVLSEPTLAALSYGLGASTMEKTVIVVDMGGGTTDVTVTELCNDKQRVIVTSGAQVGGNDVDQAILEWFLHQIEPSMTTTNRAHEFLSSYEYQLLLRVCKNAKEDLCTMWSTSDYVDLSFQTRAIRMDKETFEAITKPVLARTEATVTRALEKYFNMSSASTGDRHGIDEVVLVGGSTKIPALANMLKRATRCQELCHVHPLTAVAQGAAIHAARLSSCVPIYELQSALLLDVLPYSIGILVSPSSSSSSPLQGGSDFVPVLSQYASVPATGSVRFALANNEQTGVTVPVVECIDEDCRQIEMINTFQFLLHKLPPEDLRTISTRFVEIRIHFTELGQLIVTAIDEHDPEHQRKYNLLGDNTTTSAAPFNAPPLGLVVTAISLAVLYVAVKLAFHEVELKQ